MSGKPLRNPTRLLPHRCPFGRCRRSRRRRRYGQPIRLSPHRWNHLDRVFKVPWHLELVRRVVDPAEHVSYPIMDSWGVLQHVRLIRCSGDIQRHLLGDACEAHAFHPQLPQHCERRDVVRASMQTNTVGVPPRFPETQCYQRCKAFPALLANRRACFQSPRSADRRARYCRRSTPSACQRRL